MEAQKIAAMNARKSSEWMKKSVMYQIYLRSFTPEGTLKAATEKLPEVAELGVDILYLCPICLQDDDMRREFWSERQKKYDNPRNPYRIKDYYSIDPEYGADADLRNFVNAAHSLGMKVLLDLVFLHCGPTAVFIDEYTDFVKRNPDGSILNGLWNFPLLNFDSQALRKYLWENMEYWLKEFKVDGYRCDVAFEIPLDFWEEARRRLENIDPDVLMLSEGQRVDDQLFAFDLDYCFTGVGELFNIFKNGNPVSKFRETWELMRSERPAGTRFIRYIDNHDLAHDTSHEMGGRIDEIWGTKAVDALLVLCFTLDGMPFLYNGQEVTDTAPHSIYGKVPVNWEKSSTQEGIARRSLCKQLCALRHSETALLDGDMEWVENGQPDKILSFSRKTDSGDILVIINLSDTGLDTWVMDHETGKSECKSLLSYGTCITNAAEDTKTCLNMDAFGFIVLKKD